MENPMISRLNDMARNAYASETASYMGVALKSFLLVAIVIASAFATWYFGYATPTTTTVTAIMGLVCALVVSFKPTMAGFLSPLYAILEGMCLASISFALEMMYPGIVMNAVMLTFGIALAAAAIYSRGLVTVNARFMRFTMVALVGVMLAYLGEAVLSLFGVNFPALSGSGPLGIGVSIVVIGVATLSLFMDYEVINQSVQQGMPKDYEWYCAFSLLVTLIWLYVEALDLLRKISSRD